MERINSFCTVAIASADTIPADVPSVISSLPFGEKEKERLIGKKNPQSQAESLCALICLEKLLKSVGLDKSFADMSIMREESGKPHFNDLPLFFSITHSRALCAVALSNRPVGIDLEFIDQRRNFLDISKRFFSSEECIAIHNSTSVAKDFFALWTKKEALSKLNGKGLASICADTLTLSDNYCFKEYSIDFEGEAAYMTLCFDGEVDTVSIHNPYKELKIYEI